MSSIQLLVDQLIPILKTSQSLPSDYNWDLIIEKTRQSIDREMLLLIRSNKEDTPVSQQRLIFDLFLEQLGKHINDSQTRKHDMKTSQSNEKLWTNKKERQLWIETLDLQKKISDKNLISAILNNK